MIKICRGSKTYKIHLSEKEEKKINKILDVLNMIDVEIDREKNHSKCTLVERVKILKNSLDVVWKNQIEIRRHMKKTNRQKPVEINPDPDLKLEWKLT